MGRGPLECGDSSPLSFSSQRVPGHKQAYRKPFQRRKKRKAMTSPRTPKYAAWSDRVLPNLRAITSPGHREQYRDQYWDRYILCGRRGSFRYERLARQRV